MANLPHAYLEKQEILQNHVHLWKWIQKHLMWSNLTPVPVMRQPLMSWRKSDQI